MDRHSFCFWCTLLFVVQNYILHIWAIAADFLAVKIKQIISDNEGTFTILLHTAASTP